MIPETPQNEGEPGRSSVERKEDWRKVRRLQLMVDMVLHVIRQDPDLALQEATELVGRCRSMALAMFPDKEFTYDLIYKPRLQRAVAERFEDKAYR